MRRYRHVDLAEDRVYTAHVDLLSPLAAVFEHAQIGAEDLRRVALLTPATEVVDEYRDTRESFVDTGYNLQCSDLIVLAIKPSHSTNSWCAMINSLPMAMVLV